VSALYGHILGRAGTTGGVHVIILRLVHILSDRKVSTEYRESEAWTGILNQSDAKMSEQRSLRVNKAPQLFSLSL